MKLFKWVASAALASLLVLGSNLAFAQDGDPANEDSEAPSYVDNVVAAPEDGAVTLTWDAATDNVAVTGYVIYYGPNSVSEAGQDYESIEEIGDMLEYTVEGLTNDTAYYFAVTALDAAGNESFDYSYEASATPVAAQEGAPEDNGTPPTVISASALACSTVHVTFSESVVLPAENAPQSFTLEDLDSLEFLDVTDASLLEGDDTTVVLTTADMGEEAQYLLTAGVALQDLEGNAVVSGTSDTAVFGGVACPEVVDEEPPAEEAPEEEADTEAPTLDSAEVISLTEIKLTFNEETTLPELEEVAEGEEASEEEPVDPALELFSIFDDEDNAIEILEVNYVVDDLLSLMLTTSEHAEGKEYFVSVTGLEDVEGNATDGDFRSSASYTTPEPEVVEEEPEPEPDTIAPEDVQGLVTRVNDLLVDLNWSPSLNSAGDLVEQILYVSRDGGTSFEPMNLAADATSYQFDGGVEGESYMFKVTTRDGAGNESEGVTVTAALPVTGPALGLLAAASLFGGRALSRRRREG